MTQEIHIVFEGEDVGTGLRFVEIETPDGRSVAIGRWIERPDGLPALVISAEEVAALGGPSKAS